MSRLYWRIFLAFWAVILATTVIAFSVSVLGSRAQLAETRMTALRASLNALAEQAQRSVDVAGEAGLRRWLAEQEARLPLPVLALDEQGRDLLKRPVPPGLGRFVERRLTTLGDPETPRFRPPLQRVVGPDGRAYALVIPPDFRRPPRWVGGFVNRGVFAVVLLVVSGVVCLLLARYLTRPVRALRAAGQRFGKGDMTARVGAAAGQRNDELGALARDFDRMAEQVQALVESKQRLLRDVSHELRSPLARLQTAAGLLRQRNGIATNDNLDRIDQEVARLDTLVAQILRFSRVDSLPAIDKHPVDLNDLLAEIVADAQYEATPDDKRLVLKAPVRITVEGDEPLLRSAIENVVRNALRHCRACVTVRLSRDANGSTTIEVADDGDGVPPADLPRLFEPFFAGAQGAAGIGLAIARAALGLHAGSILARNVPEGGLTVILTLPGGPDRD